METTVQIPGADTVSALLSEAPNAHAMYVLAHGAGAGMRHPFMESIAERLAARGVSTLRYQFPSMERGRRSPDKPAVAVATVRAAVAAADGNAGGLPLFAGGKSFGGRMTSTAAAEEPLPGVRGLVFLGFPLHAPKRVSVTRAEHLDRVSVPMLFLQGTRDDLADLPSIREVCAQLGERATLHVVEGGDHSFRVLKRSGRTNDAVMDELAETISAWTRGIVQ